MAGFLFRLETVDGAPAEPPTVCDGGAELVARRCDPGRQSGAPSGREARRRRRPATSIGGGGRLAFRLRPHKSVEPGDPFHSVRNVPRSGAEQTRAWDAYNRTWSPGSFVVAACFLRAGLVRCRSPAADAGFRVGRQHRMALLEVRLPSDTVTAGAQNAACGTWGPGHLSSSPP
jgi:hypothetical protein